MLCLSAQMRIASSRYTITPTRTKLCLSAQMRIASHASASRQDGWGPLPQRTNADCIHDYFSSCLPSAHFASAHKCGLHPGESGTALRAQPFASAHKCGLHPLSISFSTGSTSFASAHKCGLHRQYCTKMRYPFLQIAL